MPSVQNSSGHGAMRNINPGREEVRAVVENTAATHLKGMVDSVSRGDPFYTKHRFMPLWAAYYSILAADEQQALMKKQQRLTSAMHKHSWIMLVMTAAIIMLAAVQICLLLKA